MANYRLFEETAFDDGAVKVMAAAYEEARRELKLADRTHPLNETTAMEIVEAAKLGELDPTSLKNRAVEAVRDRVRPWPDPASEGH